jgi:hypothetical protein
MARWFKLGRLYEPAGVHPKLATHAANPLPVLLAGDVYRVFYSGRDAGNRSSVGYVDIDIVLRKVIHVHKEPVFTYGPEGSFYSHGVSLGNCYEADGHRYILFMGWQIPPQGHWRGDIGRLVLKDDTSLVLDGSGPLMSSCTVDPLSLSYPWVMRQPDQSYRMWYGSTVIWDTGNGEMLHVLNQARSGDGHHWERLGNAVPFALGKAQAFSRPTVVGGPAEGYHMWFSTRSGAGEAYRIGYAYSRDGDAWSLRLEDAGIDVSETAEDWDAEMIEYPFVLDHKGRRYMLYNGNGYGRSGFGLAVWE